MKADKSIVVGMDFSPDCDRTLSVVERLAKAKDEGLTVVHALDQSVADRLNRNDTTTRRNGILSPSNSVKLECVRRSHCDVLLVRENQKTEFRKIVACVDFSAGSEKAVERAHRMAKQDGAKLEILHVYPPIEKQIASRHYFIPILSEVVSENDDIAEVKIRKELKTLTEKSTDGSVECSNIILRQLDHKRAIIDYLNTSGVDLVVMGKRGRANMREMILGTTAERVVNHAQCSVLLVNPK